MKKHKKPDGDPSVIMHYGYSDGSGDYYVTLDTDKCNGCGLCIQKCPQGMLQLETIFIDLEDKTVASVKEEHRKKIKYTCASCKPEKNKTLCQLACKTEALKCTWKKQ
jgi:Fe-S-cluster-containing hydrogenase component 2